MIKYDDLTTEISMSEYIFNVYPYEGCNKTIVADLEDSIRIALELSESNGMTIDCDGMWYIYGERC